MDETTMTKIKPLTDEEKDRLDELETDMDSLHESLTRLLGSMPVISKTPSSTSPLIDGVTEEGLKQFRSRVARRIYFYSPQIREYLSLYERLPEGLERQHAEGVYRYHRESLPKFKTEISSWWRNIERRFHRLRVASLLSKKSNEFDDDDDDDGDKKIDKKNRSGPGGWIASLRNGSRGSKVTAGLRELKQNMEVEVERMEATGQALELSSQKLQFVDSLFSDFGSHLSAARTKLNTLKRRAEKDSTYVWWAFIFFVSVCGFILAKRTRVLRTAVWVLDKGLALAIFSTKSAYQLTSRLSSRPSLSVELRSLAASSISSTEQPMPIRPTENPIGHFVNSVLKATDDILLNTPVISEAVAEAVVEKIPLATIPGIEAEEIPLVESGAIPFVESVMEEMPVPAIVEVAEISLAKASLGEFPLVESALEQTPLVEAMVDEIPLAAIPFEGGAVKEIPIVEAASEATPPVEAQSQEITHTTVSVVEAEEIPLVEVGAIPPVVEAIPSVEAVVEAIPSVEAVVEAIPSVEAVVEAIPSVEAVVEAIPSVEAQMEETSLLEAVEETPVAESAVEETSVAESALESIPAVEAMPEETPLAPVINTFPEEVALHEIVFVPEEAPLVMSGSLEIPLLAEIPLLKPVHEGVLV